MTTHFFESLEKFNPSTLPKNSKKKDEKIKLLDINVKIKKIHLELAS